MPLNEKIDKLKTKLDDFMKAAFEPKSITTARRKKKKSERKIDKKKQKMTNLFVLSILI